MIHHTIHQIVHLPGIKSWALYSKETESFAGLTFFPPCFSTMSVLRGKWSSWGVLAPPPLGIVQLSPRQASFTLPLHRHQLSRTKKERSTVIGGGTNWLLPVSENCGTSNQLLDFQGLSSFTVIKRRTKLSIHKYYNKKGKESTQTKKKSPVCTGQFQYNQNK